MPTIPKMIPNKPRRDGFVLVKITSQMKKQERNAATKPTAGAIVFSFFFIFLPPIKKKFVDKEG